MSKLNKRRRKIINPRFQLSFIVIMITVNALAILLFTGGLYLFLDSEIEANLLSAQVSLNNMRDLLPAILLVTGLLITIISSSFIFIIVLLASHRVAGPIYRFQKILDSFVDNKYPETTDIRAGDQFEEISRSTRRFLNKLSDDHSELLKLINKKPDNWQQRAEELISIYCDSRSK